MLDRLKDKAFVDGKQLIDIFVSKTSETAKKDVQEIFSSPTSHIRCLIATKAFGMGIDIPDIELIVHWGVSSSVLDYWQEVGRCGRDGRTGEALVLATKQSLGNKHMTDNSIRELNEHIMSDKSCIRLCVLNALYLECMDKDELDKVSRKDDCEALCTPSSTCSCQRCSCCSVCRLACNCRNTGFTVYPELQRPLVWL
jgi:superfamily II DNA helicase RecQ